MIPNRNHSAFLGDCIESALAQTYRNTEIVVLDNCSKDDSVSVVSKYLDRGVRLCKNPLNVGNVSYKFLAMLSEGDYMILLCADDLIDPCLIEKAVSVMEKHPGVGYVHCDRNYIDGNGKVTELDPFFNRSFMAPGESVLPIYMLTDIAQASQCVMRRKTFEKVLGYDTEFDHANADKELWFRLSLVSDYAYIRERLALIRLHEARETTLGFRSFFHPLAIYLTLDNQAGWGEMEGRQNVLERLPAAHRKLASECLRIGFFCMKESRRALAGKYMLFSEIINEDVVHDEQYKRLRDLYERSAKVDWDEKDGASEPDMFSRHMRNYDPPEGFEGLDINDYVA